MRDKLPQSRKASDNQHSEAHPFVDYSPSSLRVEVLTESGVTREEAMPPHECYLEYLWVAPDFRQAGLGSILLRTVLDRLRDSGVHTVWLYILNGNHGAMRFYHKFGFQSTNERQLLPDHPAGSEERMKLRLD
jgi:ribosomal protein S18 acetylase RimI-like enzyme